MNLNDAQKNAVFHPEGNLLVTASPGSGKTRTLVARALHKLESLPKHKIVGLITYTNAAADEISERFPVSKPVFIGTIHRFCLEFVLRPFGWIYNWNIPKIITFDQQKIFFEENNDIKLDTKFGQNRHDELGKIKKTLDGSLDLEVNWEHEISLNSVAERYYEFQKSQKVIDFNEILFRSYKLVSENPFICKSLSSMFFEILVDEFQDTNQFQYEILKKINSQKLCTFFMVGDNRQKIYSFAGAIENAFAIAQSDFCAKNISLKEVFRSTNSIVQSYRKLFNDHPKLENKSINAELEIDLKFVETDSRNHSTKLEEVVDYLVDEVNINPEDIAVLSKSWWSSFNASRILRRKYEVVGLGALPHRNQSNSTFLLLKSLSRYYFDPSIRTLKVVRRNVENHLMEYGLLKDENTINKDTNNLIKYFSGIEFDQSLDDGFDELHSVFGKVFQVSHSSFFEILGLISDEEKRYWTIEQYLNTLAGLKGILSNTIHRAKGLEFEAVILNGINRGTIPYQETISRNPYTLGELTTYNIEEGRKLFYVAISRAKKHLIILHNNYPSMFIDLIKVH